MADNAPWTIKAVPVHVREKAVRYARMDGLTVAEWLARAVETEANRQDGNQIIPPDRLPTPPSIDLATIAAALSAMAQAQAAGLPVAKAAARETVAMIREHVRVGRGLPVRPTRPQIRQTISHDTDS